MIEPLVVPVDRYLVPGLPTVWFGVVFFTLATYVALDGFDFGIGMLYATRSSDHDRETLLAAFGPVWDANEVWLVAFGTTLLAAFPPVYSRLLSDHYLLALGAVVALLFRGVAPELREHVDESWKPACDRLFVVGSALTPLLLGTLVGSWTFATPTLSPPSVLTGVALVALSVASGAAFLAAKTAAPLADQLAKYGIGGLVAYLLCVVVLLALVFAQDVGGMATTLRTPAASGAVLGTVAVGVASVAFGHNGRYRAWFASTLALSGLLIGLVAVSLYPVVYPATGATVASVVVSPLALNLVTVMGIPMLVVVLLYFRYLYGVFAGPVDEAGYGG